MIDAPADILVLDPPWRFASNSDAKPNRNARRHYRCLRDSEIAALPVLDWSAPASILFMWTTAPMLERSMRVVREAWPRFRYTSHFVWPKDRIATGYWIRNQHEICLLYRRGAFPCPRPAPFGSSLIDGAQREHSRKPDSLQDRIDAVWPEARKAELFARQSRPGWIAWGNEIDRFGYEAAP